LPEALAHKPMLAQSLGPQEELLLMIGKGTPVGANSIPPS
jgi:hypothetical protein